jgi:hypothetical protein
MIVGGPENMGTTACYEVTVSVIGQREGQSTDLPRPARAVAVGFAHDVTQQSSRGKMLLVSVCLSLVAATLYATDLATIEKPPMDRIGRIEAMKEFLPQLRPLEKTRSKDLEIQVGLAALYASYGNSPDQFDRHRVQVERVLELDPNNKSAWQMRANDALGQALRMQRDTIGHVEKMIASAKERGATSIPIFSGPPLNYPITDPAERSKWNSPLAAILGDKSGAGVITEEKDYDQAIAKVRQRANDELNQAVIAVDEAGKHDPENAFLS